MVAFLATIGPGFLILYHYRPADFAKRESLKICVLAIGLTLPFVLVNILAAVGVSNWKKSEAAWISLLGVFGAAVALNAALGLAYWRSLDFRHFLQTVIAVQAFLIASMIV